MLELYHYAFSTCSQKVRLVLAEKGLDFVSHEVDLMTGGQHDAEYVKLNPNHVVPTLVHDGVGLIESTLINEYLDEAFPDDADATARSARPACGAPVDKARRREGPCRDGGGDVCDRRASGPAAAAQRDPRGQHRSIPDPADREARRSVIEHGVEAPSLPARWRR